MLKVTFNDHDTAVTLFATSKPHNCHTLEASNNKMTDEVRNFIRIQYEKGLKPKAIQDAFIEEKIPLPPKYLINNELKKLRKLKDGSTAFKVSDLYKLLEDHKPVPEDELAAYVLDFQINDDSEELKFNFVVSSKKLLRNNVSSDVCNADSTYKLIWQGFPVQVVGFTDGNKTFHPNSISVSTHESQEDYHFVFNALKEGTTAALNEQWHPSTLMCDAAKAISNAFRLVFGDDIIESMCWFHAKCAMGDQVANLIPKNEQHEVISDIDVLQLSQTPDMFRKASELGEICTIRRVYCLLQTAMAYFASELV